MSFSNIPLRFAAADHRRQRGRVFGILPADLLRHALVIGRTGAGKTVLLEHLLHEAFMSGLGCGLLDPHGDLVERLLERVPRHRLNDVVLFDPADRTSPPGLNLLEHVPPDARPRIASGVLSVFRKVFHEFWGPRLEHVFRNCLLALLDVPGSTLLSVMRLLVDEQYRTRILAQVQDPVVRFYWTHEWPLYPKSFLPEVISPVQNKLGAALTNPLLRNILGQPTSTIRGSEIMDDGRIFLTRLAKGLIGEEASVLLGAILVAHFQLAAYARAAVPESERRPFVLFIDEFASFVTPSFTEILAEARKFGLGLVLAHQYLDQLDPALRPAVLGNVGSLMVFRVSAHDAETLEPEFAPEFRAADLADLGSHQLALRLSVEGAMSHPFTATTLPPLPVAPDEGHAALIRRISAERYGRPRARVERAVKRELGA